MSYLLKITLILFFALNLYGAENKYEKKYFKQIGTNTIEIIHSYRLSKFWVFERFKIEDGDWQELLDKKVFTNSDEFENFSVDQEKNLLENNYIELSDEVFEKTLNTFDFPMIKNDLWDAKSGWSEAWEVKYAAWISSIDVKTFFRTNNIATDCADVPIALRWIFARIHRLPMASTLSASGMLFSHLSSRKEWKNLSSNPKWNLDKRFLAALKYILANTFTHSLMKDSYPIKININSLLPGTHHLEIRDVMGHTLLVDKIDPEAKSNLVMRMQYSDLPSQVRDLYTSGYWYAMQPREGKGGFLRMRWPVIKNGKWTLLEANKHPMYSQEQYRSGFMRDGEFFSSAIRRNLTKNSNYLNELKDYLSSLNTLLEMRVDVVQKGFEYCKKNDCRPGTNAWEEWSTPSRDKRVVEMIHQIENIIDQSNEEQDKLKEYWINYQERTVFSVENQKIKLKKIAELFLSEKFSSDPRDSVRRRWGLED